jgi:hypothetical protein
MGTVPHSTALSRTHSDRHCRAYPLNSRTTSCHHHAKCPVGEEKVGATLIKKWYVILPSFLKIKTEILYISLGRTELREIQLTKQETVEGNGE